MQEYLYVSEISIEIPIRIAYTMQMECISWKHSSHLSRQLKTEIVMSKVLKRNYTDRIYKLFCPALSTLPQPGFDLQPLL